MRRILWVGSVILLVLAMHTVYAGPTWECVLINMWSAVEIDTCPSGTDCGNRGCWKRHWEQKQCVGPHQAPCRERRITVHPEYYRSPCVLHGGRCVCRGDYRSTGIFADPIEVPDC